MVFGLVTLAVALYVLPAALASDPGKRPAPKHCWSGPLNWLKSCCPPDIYTCRPEPEYCQPECVVAPCLCREEAKYGQPECVACDPEPHCREACPVHVAENARLLK
jgi:hypothetical protein